MLKTDPWLLPEGFEELLPDQAKRLESLRRKLLDTFARWGYELVIPPMIEYLDSLLTGSGHDLDLQTFKLIDQLSGQVLGIRADMTPQVARIDAHHLRQQGPTRLCYAGTILHTRGDPLEKTRSPMQIGAELYGHAGIESDFEIIQLMLETLALAGVENVHLDLGHVGIFRGLTQLAGLNEQQESALFDILQRKSKAELKALMAELAIDEQLKAIFLLLPELNGGPEVIQKTAQLLTLDHDALTVALADLEYLTLQLNKCFPNLPISFDMAELRGYYYHTGVVFAAFVPSVGREIARGGRYDNIGEVFGRARPATGFSSDLKLLSVLNYHSEQHKIPPRILAPYADDPELSELIRDLRARGNVVIQQLPGQATVGVEQLNCTAVISKTEQGWIKKNLET